MTSSLYLKAPSLVIRYPPNLAKPRLVDIKVELMSPVGTLLGLGPTAWAYMPSMCPPFCPSHRPGGGGTRRLRN